MHSLLNLKILRFSRNIDVLVLEHRLVSFPLKRDICPNPSNRCPYSHYIGFIVYQSSLFLLTVFDLTLTLDVAIPNLLRHFTLTLIHMDSENDLFVLFQLATRI